MPREKNLYKNISRFKSNTVIFSHSIYENFQKNEDWIHISDSYEILFCVESHGMYTVEDKTYKLHDNDVIISHPGQRHINSYKVSGNYERFHIRFNPRMMPTDFTELLPKDFCVFSAKEHPEVIQLFKTLDIYCKTLEGNVLQYAIESAVINLMFCLLAISKSNGTAVDYHANQLMTKVIEYVDKHICEPLLLETLCDDLFISKSYLHHIFVENLKISPKKYIMSKKLYHAQKEIRSGKTPTSIFAKYGFTNYSSFYRAYVNHVGYPPSDENKRKDKIIDNFML